MIVKLPNHTKANTHLSQIQSSDPKVKLVLAYIDRKPECAEFLDIAISRLCKNGIEKHKLHNALIELFLDDAINDLTHD